MSIGAFVVSFTLEILSVMKLLLCKKAGSIWDRSRSTGPANHLDQTGPLDWLSTEFT